jgi:hypothetical protein
MTTDYADLQAEPSTRNQAFMTGFAHQMFRIHELPREIAIWMIDQGQLICCVHSAVG